MTNFKSKIVEIRYFVITFVSLLGIVGVMLLDPIAQDLEYHQFSDQKKFLGIPNFLNIITNIPFLLVGVAGLYSIFRSHQINLINDMRAAYILFFTGVSLVAFGSAYYHLSPNNMTLAWERLPMTFAFMALFSIVIGEFMSSRIGKLALWPLIIFGGFSIIYWNYTESNGEGDLRLYILVQFLPVVLIPIILLLFKLKFTHSSGYWFLVSAYILAKVFEYFDTAIHNNLILLSGHSLKHLVAALGIFFLIKSYNNRKLIELK